MLVTKAAECVSSHDARPPRPRPRPRPGFPPVLSPASTRAPTPTSRTISKTSTRASSPGFRPGTPPRTSNDRVRAWATTTTTPPGWTSGSSSPRNPSRRAPPERHPTSSPCSPRSSAARLRRRASPAKTTRDWPARISRIPTRRVGFFRGKSQPRPHATTTGARSSGLWAPRRGSSSRPPSPPSPRSSSSRASRVGQPRGRTEPGVTPRRSPRPRPPRTSARHSWRAGSNPTAPRVSTRGTTTNDASRRPCPSSPRATTTTTTHAPLGTTHSCAPGDSSAGRRSTSACKHSCRSRSGTSPSSRRGWRSRSRRASS